MLALVGLLAAPLAANAAPVTYYFTGGVATVTLTAGLTEIGSATIQMDGLYVTFDEDAPELVDFRFTTAPTGAITLTTPYGGYDEIQVLGSALSPSVGYTNLYASNVGAGEYAVTVGPVDVSGAFSAHDSSGTNPDIVAQAFGFTNPFLSATLALNDGTLDIIGITLGVLPPGAGELEPLVIKADLSWTGASPIPEPSSVVLGLAGGALVANALRKRIRPA